MQKITLNEMIAIVCNRAHDYKVTIFIMDGIGTLVAASEDSNNVYTTQITDLVYKGREESEYGFIVNVYTTDELEIYVRGDDTVEVIEIPRSHMFWDALFATTGNLEGAL